MCVYRSLLYASRTPVMRSPGPHNEQELVAALNRGDRKAFEIIYRAYAPEIFRHIQRNITVREDCEEILHDLFEWIWRKHKEVKLISLRGYLFKMANNGILMYFRKNKARRNYERHFIQFEAAFDYLFDDDKEKAIDPLVLQSLLQDSLLELPERCQEAFRLRLKENLSNAEIAKRMNINKGTVENYMVHALSHLHHSYERICKAS